MLQLFKASIRYFKKSIKNNKYLVKLVFSLKNLTTNYAYPVKEYSAPIDATGKIGQFGNYL